MLFLVVFLTLLASFFLPSHLSLKQVKHSDFTVGSNTYPTSGLVAGSCSLDPTEERPPQPIHTLTMHDQRSWGEGKGRKEGSNGVGGRGEGRKEAREWGEGRGKEGSKGVGGGEREGRKQGSGGRGEGRKEAREWGEGRGKEGSKGVGEGRGKEGSKGVGGGEREGRKQGSGGRGEGRKEAMEWVGGEREGSKGVGERRERERERIQYSAYLLHVYILGLQIALY